MTLAGLVAALGLVLAAEGLLYALFPGAVREVLGRLLALPEPALRGVGLAVAALGAVLALVAGIV